MFCKRTDSPHFQASLHTSGSLDQRPGVCNIEWGSTSGEWRVASGVSLVYVVWSLQMDDHREARNTAQGPQRVTTSWNGVFKEVGAFRPLALCTSGS